MGKPVLIFGAKALGKVVVDIFKGNGIEIYGLVDDDKDLYGTSIDEIPILGSTDDENLLKIIGDSCDVFLAYDDNRVKKSLIKMLKEEYKSMPVNAIHKSSYISSSAEIHYGSLINIGCSIGAFAKIGNHCLINTHATIEHEARIGDFVQIGAGSIINSGVVIEDEAFVGSGVTIVSGIFIGKKARIGAGSVVIENVKEGITVFGNPAKPV